MSPEEAYEAEQASLLAEYDGETPDIQIEVPKEPEVNPEVYKDVEPMLYRGFLTLTAEVNGIFFVFKSLNHHELELLKFSGAFHGSTSSAQSWNTFLSYAVFMVNGVNILPRRDDWVHRFAEVFEHLPNEARFKIVRHIGEINRRAAKSISLVEAYAMEGVSRYRWMQLKGLDLTSTAVTGVDGTSRLGLNWAQQLWRALNQADDRNEEHEREWDNAKFVGSCFAGKGISKVFSRDNERRRKEREERAARKDQILRELILGEKPLPATGTLAGATLVAPRTVEELADQLTKDLRGEKDHHDRVVEEHERRVRERYNQRRTELADAASRSEQMFSGHQVVGSSSLEGLTPAQAEERIRMRKQLMAQAAARLQLNPIPDEKKTAFLDKWIDGSSPSDASVAPPAVVPLPADSRPRGTPFRRQT